MTKLQTGSSLLLAAALAAPSAMADGKIGLGVAMAPDYERQLRRQRLHVYLFWDEHG